jgi:hypothetical protein
MSHITCVNEPACKEATTSSGLWSLKPSITTSESQDQFWQLQAGTTAERESCEMSHSLTDDAFQAWCILLANPSLPPLMRYPNGVLICWMSCCCVPYLYTTTRCLLARLCACYILYANSATATAIAAAASILLVLSFVDHSQPTTCTALLSPHARGSPSKLSYCCNTSCPYTS